MTSLPITSTFLIGSRRSVRLIERNLLVYKHGWMTILSGFFEPLFYLLSIAEPKAYLGGQTVRLFSKGEVHSVEVRFTGDEELPVDFDLHPALEQSTGDTAAPGTRHVEQRVHALRYTLHPADEADALELLGLEGDIEIWIDAERRMPILVSGKVSPVGRVSVKLQRAWLAR